MSENKFKIGDRVLPKWCNPDRYRYSHAYRIESMGFIDNGWVYKLSTVTGKPLGIYKEDDINLFVRKG